MMNQQKGSIVAKKSKSNILLKKQIKPVKGSSKISNTFFSWCISILVFSVSVSFYISTQLPTIDIKWLLLIMGATLLALFWLIQCSLRKSWRWVGHPNHFPLLVFVVINLITQFWPGNRSSLLENWIQWFSLILLYWVVTQTTKNIRGIHIIIQGLLLGGLVASLYGIIQKLGWDPFHWQKNNQPGNITSMLGNSDLFGWFLASLFPLSIGFLFTIRKNKLDFGLRILYILLIVFGLLITGNRAGLLAALGSVFIVGWMILHNPEQCKLLFSEKWFAQIQRIYSYRRLWKTIVLGILVIGFISYWHKYSSTSDIAIKGRFLHWQTSIRMIEDHPILGLGQGNYFVQYLDYQAKVVNDTRNKGYHRISQEVQDINAAYAHNEFLQAFTDTGIIGFASFLFLLLTLLWMGYYEFQLWKDRHSLWLYLGCYGGILAVLISALFGFPLHVPASAMQFWVLLGLMVALCNLEQAHYSTNKIWPIFVYENPLTHTVKIPVFIFLVTLFFAGYGYWAMSSCLDSFRASFYIRIGRIFAEDEKNSNFPLAVQFMEHAIELTPDNGLAHYYLGGYYARLNRLDDAIKEYSKATTNYNDIRIDYNLGQIYFSKQDYSIAEEYYKRTLLLNDTFFMCHRQLGFIDMYLHKDPKKTIEEFSQYLNVQKNGGDADNIRNLVKELEKQIPK